ncbi:MAG: hypothetical protein E6Q97_09480 [Desulfurellales bacterium]|nr:MAG: hypothetical protein E6Q97_09480 [Desulfurellales bacterium]
MKTCKGCGLTKESTEFYAQRSMTDGLAADCKDCYKARVKANRLKRIDHYRAYDTKRAKRPERAKAAAEISKVWRQQDSRRMACHNAVTRAVRAGKLERKPCERCSAVKSYAHHESYDRKLDVVWLCQPCHKQRHKEMVLEGIEP